MRAVVARSTFRSQNVQSTHKHTILGSLLEIELSKKCTPLWLEAHFEVKMLKTPGVRTTFEGSDVVFAWQAQGIPHLAKRDSAVCISKNNGMRGTFPEDLQRCMSRGRRSTRDMFIRDVL